MREDCRRVGLCSSPGVREFNFLHKFYGEVNDAVQIGSSDQATLRVEKINKVPEVTVGGMVGQWSDLGISSRGQCVGRLVGMWMAYGRVVTG